MKLEFTFDTNKHKFKCTRCGKCCYPAGLTITKKEYENIIKFITNSKVFTNILGKPFSYIFEIRGRCPFLTDEKLCKIYQNRPIMCVSFPLTFDCLPDGRFFVNYIRCEGDDIDDGELVNQEFVIKTIDEIKNREPNFFDELLINKLSQPSSFVPFYSLSDVTSYESKLNFRKFLVELLKKYVTDRNNFRAQIHSYIQTAKSGIEQILYEKWRNSAIDRILILDEDLNFIKDQLSRYFMKNFQQNVEEISKIISESEKNAMTTGVCELYLDGRIKKMGINELIRWKINLYNGKEEVSAKVFQLYFRKRLNHEALYMIVEYLAEILTRVGLGGFPLDAPISTTLSVLGEYVNNIEFYYNLYSGRSDEVPIDAVKKAIQDLDTNFALGSIYVKRVGQSFP